MTLSSGKSGLATPDAHIVDLKNRHVLRAPRGQALSAGRLVLIDVELGSATSPAGHAERSRARDILRAGDGLDISD